MTKTTASTAAAPTFADVMAMAKPREATARICLAGDLAAEADRLEAELAALASYTPTSLADVDPRPPIESELAEVYDQMRAAEVTVRFRALGRQAYSDLVAAHPGRDDSELWNPDTFMPALIIACVVEPEMSAEQAEQLLDVLNDKQRGDLWRAAFRANNGEVKVPFSPAASPATSSSGGK